MSEDTSRIMRCYEGKRHMYLTVVRAAQAGKLDEMDPMAVEMTKEQGFFFSTGQVNGHGIEEAGLIEVEQRLVAALETLVGRTISGGYTFTLLEFIIAIRESGWVSAMAYISDLLKKARSDVAGYRENLIITACLDAMFAAKEAGLEVRL